MNHLHIDLVEAEKARVLGQFLDEAEELYERAIAGASEHESIQEVALAYELAAKHYLAQGREKFAQTYMKESHYCYERWGATAKVKELETCYPQFFAQKSASPSTDTTAGNASNHSVIATLAQQVAQRTAALQKSEANYRNLIQTANSIILRYDLLLSPSVRSNTMSQAIQVLIADDHAIFRQGLATIISRDPDIRVIAQAENGQQAIDLFQKHQPDVTLMDLRMPEVEGVKAISAICATAKSALIIVLTTYDSDEEIYRGLQAGAKGYLLKETEPDELLNAIRTVYQGRQYIPPDVGAKLVQRMSNPELSERELAVLRSMAQGMSNADIATALSIGEGTVKSHVNRILNKLDVSDRTQAVIVAVKRGIVCL